MIVLLDEHIPCEDFAKISTRDDIKHSKPNSVVIFDFDKDLMLYCATNDIEYAINVSNITEAVYANSLNAKYIFPTLDIIENIQELANNYMFDSKVVAKIKTANQIEQFALKQIDGVIFQR
jgi:hypothetical protein